MTDTLGNVPMLVLRTLMSKRGWHSFSHLVNAESFESNEYRRIYQHLERLHGVTESDMTVEGLRADFDVTYHTKPDLLEEMALVLDRLERTEELAQDLMESLVRRFLERSIAHEIAEQVLNGVDKPGFSISTVTDLAARAVEVGERVSQVVADVLESPLSGASDNRRIAYSLGCSRELDRGLRGGVAPGELCIYLAPPARGKTSFLCRTGASHAAKGGRVLHVTLEINTRKVIERYDQCWTAKGSEELETSEGQEAVQIARDIVREAGGRVWVVDWSYLQVSANDVGALVRRMKGMGMDIDMVIVDYLMLMSTNKIPGKEMRQKFSAIGQEMRALARNLEIPVVTAWQVNRAGSDETLLSERHIAESWDTIMIADIVLGLNQSREQLQNQRLVLNIVKQRESTGRGMYELYCDLERMVVRDVSHEDTRDQINAVIGRVDEEATRSN